MLHLWTKGGRGGSSDGGHGGNVGGVGRVRVSIERARVERGRIHEGYGYERHDGFLQTIFMLIKLAFEIFKSWRRDEEEGLKREWEN